MQVQHFTTNLLFFFLLYAVVYKMTRKLRITMKHCNENINICKPDKKCVCVCQHTSRWPQTTSQSLLFDNIIEVYFKPHL